LIRQLDAGETFDVAFVWPAMIDRRHRAAVSNRWNRRSVS
jgi:hypothetical protein